MVRDTGHLDSINAEGALDLAEAKRITNNIIQFPT